MKRSEQWVSLYLAELKAEILAQLEPPAPKPAPVAPWYEAGAAPHPPGAR